MGEMQFCGTNIVVAVVQLLASWQVQHSMMDNHVNVLVKRRTHFARGEVLKNTGLCPAAKVMSK